MRALAVLVAAAAFPRAAALVVYYNVFSKNVATAVEIVYEQLTELRAAPIWRGAWTRTGAPSASTRAAR